MGVIKQTAHEYYSGTNLGSYQFISLDNIINNFMIGYVGEDKIISKVKRTDVLFHAKRALQELSYDTFKSIKSQEISIPGSLTMRLPQDYINYVKLSWSDSAGVEHTIYPASKTSNPNSVAQDSDGNYMFNNEDFVSENQPTNPSGLIQFPFELTTPDLNISQTQFTIFPHILGFDPTTSLNPTSDPHGYENLADQNPFKEGMEITSPYFPVGTTISSITEATGTNDMTITLSHASTNTAVINDPVIITIVDNTSETTWGKYKTANPPENATTDYNYDEDEVWPAYRGRRYGLDPEHSQVNGSFFIDTDSGLIHFSSNIESKKVILKYISDSLGTDSEMQVHKLAEEAMYKWIACAILSTRINTQEYIISRFKREKFAAVRQAKLRLSNLKVEELTQILRGKSKHIKH